MEQHYADHLAVRLAQWREALERSGYSGAAIFSGTEQTLFRDDQIYPFKVNPYFAGLLPLLQPNCCIVIDTDHQPKLLHWQTDDFWFQPPADPSGYWTEHFDIITVAGHDAMSRALPSRRDRWISVDPSPNGDSGFATVNPAPVLAEIDFHRGVKTAYELACMREASRIGVRGHRAAQAAFLSGASEFDIHQIYCQASGQAEQELPYPSIVALAPHGAILHYQHQTRSVDGAPALLIDAGGQYLGYCSDITRTWSTQPRFQALIAAMDVLQQKLCAAAAVDIAFPELNTLAHRELAHLMHDAGLLNASPEQALANNITQAFLPHGLGHLLGLQVHDAGGHSADIAGTQLPPPEGHPWLRLTRSLQTGMVVTMEPGIYFIESLLAPLRDGTNRGLVNWLEVDQYMALGGIRVEDNISITAAGHENLTREAFAAADGTG